VVSTRRRRHVGDPFEEVRLVTSIDYYLLNALVHVRRAREEALRRSFEAARVYVREAVGELEEALRLLEQAAAVAAGSSQGRAKR
jgi:16S rRNA C1402 N4-methylase RsmH